MAIVQQRSVRKATGGRYKSVKGKKKHSLGRLPIMTKLGTSKTRVDRVYGGNLKKRALNEEFVNVQGADGKSQKVKIEAVVENPANRHFVRRNILNKGTVVKTSAGNARITSRPGQIGTVNAVLIQ